MPYSKEELIQELQRVSEEHCDGEPPRIKDIRKYGKTSSYPYRDRFGSWSEAQRQCGFEPNKNSVSEEKLINELKRLSKEYCDGKPPRQADMRKEGDHSTSTYQRRFGSWGEALKEVNFEKERSSYIIEKTDLIKELERISEEHCDGRPPKPKDIEKHSKYSYSVYNKRFGGVKNIRKECNFEKELSLYRYTKKELKEELISVSENYCDGNTPTREDMNKHGRFHASVYGQRFGSWNASLEEVELEKNHESYEKEKLIQMSKEMIDKKDCTTVKKRELCDFLDISDAVIQNHFGNYRNLLDKIGAEPNAYYGETNENLLKDIKKISEKEKTSFPVKRKEYKKYGKYSSSLIESRFGTWNNALQEAGFVPRERNDWSIGSGAEHPRWKGGFEGYYGSSWYKQRQKVRERSRNKCEVCMTEEIENNYPDVHHITPVRYWDVDEEHEEMNNPRNLICLCRSCHSSLEGKFKGRNHEEFEKLAKDYLDIEKNGESDDGMSREKGIFDY